MKPYYLIALCFFIAGAYGSDLSGNSPLRDIDGGSRVASHIVPIQRQESLADQNNLQQTYTSPHYCTRRNVIIVSTALALNVVTFVGSLFSSFKAAQMMQTVVLPDGQGVYCYTTSSPAEDWPTISGVTSGAFYGGIVLSFAFLRPLCAGYRRWPFN